MVKCAECGFLSLRVGTEGPKWGLVPGTLFEASEHFRRHGANTEKVLGPYPICFVNAANLTREREDLEYRVGQQNETYDIALDETGIAISFPSEPIKWQLYVERDCRGYIDLQPGFTPKEHRDMMDRERMLKREDERDEFNRKWMVEQSKANRQFPFLVSLNCWAIYCFRCSHSYWS